MASQDGGRIVVFFLAVFIYCAHSAEWTSGPPDGDTVYVCEGDDLLLNWTYALQDGDVIHDVEWTYDGRLKEMIAVLTHGVFMPLSAYANRLQHVTNGGLLLSQVTVGDSGNYSVKVIGVDVNGASFSIERSLVAIVANHLMTRDGHLHVSSRVVQGPDHSWSAELRCGHFFFDQPVPHHVQWITPSGDVLPSSNFTGGHFTLTLPIPLVTEGAYTCRVSAQDAATCLTTDVEASVTVDNTTTRLSILEAQFFATTDRLTEAEAKLTDHKSRLTAAETELTETKAKLTVTETKLAETEADLKGVKTQLNSTQTRLTSLENRINRQVSFHAQYLASPDHQAGSRMIVSDVTTNIGDGYNSSSGVFTAPVTGTYFITASTGPWGSPSAGVWIMRDSHGIAFSTAYEADMEHGEVMTLSSVLHLDEGQTVWLKATSNASYWILSTSFGGFLITADP